MMIKKTIENIRLDFMSSQKVLVAIGDETRQHIILALMEASCGVGMRVGEITARTHLSRPAVSHHLRILKEAHVVSMRKEGTKNFYSINLNGGLKMVIQLSDHLKDYSDYLNTEE
jgi:DNA-binding transcriptional ArsR family regulator